MRALSVIIFLAILILPTVTYAEIKIFTASHTYILGDHDSKDDARQRCLLEAKRKILEQAGVYIESASEVKNFDLTKDKITSFAAAVMQVKDTKEEVSFQQGHMSLTLKLTAQVDLEEVRKQLAARQLDAGVRDTVAAQQERLKRLEAQLEAMQRQQGGQSSGHASVSPPSDFSEEELQRLHTQAAQGDALGQFGLGRLYDLGRGVPQDYAMARQWYEKAAAQGNADAQFWLGSLYNNGYGVPQDYAMARQWYEKAAAQGNADAQFKLGFLYDFGHGVPKNYAKAWQWYEQAAAQGHPWAQFKLGALYDFGRGVPQDYVKARQWYERAAAQSNGMAQSNLGLMYAYGYGVPQDYAKARQWFEKAAAQGDASAQNELGLLYSRGRGVPQDYTKARQWYEKAAAQGLTEAQNELGLMHVNGRGVPQDDVRAYMWWSLAAGHSTDNDQKLAAGYRDVIARSMTPAQIAEAQRFASRCQAQQFKGC
jgi:TPR repeat protein